MPFRIGPWEFGIILLIIFFIFGAGRLPQVGSAIGKSIRAVRRGLSGGDKKDTDEQPEREDTDIKS